MKGHIKECTYCGAITVTTVDHIPPKSIYTEPLPPNDRLPQVNICEGCNEGTSLDDENFVHDLIQSRLVCELPQTQPLLEKMFRGLAMPEKRKYTEGRIERLFEADATTFAGIHLGPQPAYRVDLARLERTGARYLKGLHRFVFGSRVSDDAEVRAMINPEAISDMASEFLETFASSRWVVIQKGTFAFKSATLAERPNGSAWLLIFFERYPVFGYVRPPVVRTES